MTRRLSVLAALSLLLAAPGPFAAPAPGSATGGTTSRSSLPCDGRPCLTPEKIVVIACVCDAERLAQLAALVRDRAALQLVLADRARLRQSGFDRAVLEQLLSLPVGTQVEIRPLTRGGGGR